MSAASLTPEMLAALRQLADVVGFDLEDGACSWFAEPEGLEEALPGLPRALFDLFSAVRQPLPLRA